MRAHHDASALPGALPLAGATVSRTRRCRFRELRNRTSDIIASVNAGERIVLTSDGLVALAARIAVHDQSPAVEVEDPVLGDGVDRRLAPEIDCAGRHADLDDELRLRGMESDAPYSSPPVAAVPTSAA